MTPYYQDDLVTIYHGDSREIVPGLTFGAIVADPPYGMSYDPRNSSRGGNDFRPVVGDSEPFDPAWLVAYGVPTVLWGPERIFRHVWAGMVRDSERGRTLHPTQKPVALMRWVLARIDSEAVVLDPFMGSGPVLEAAKSTGRRAIGIEIEEAYCERAANRCRQEVLGLVG